MQYTKRKENVKNDNYYYFNSGLVIILRWDDNKNK